MWQHDVFNKLFDISSGRMQSAISFNVPRRETCSNRYAFIAPSRSGIQGRGRDRRPRKRYSALTTVASRASATEITSATARIPPLPEALEGSGIIEGHHEQNQWVRLEPIPAI